MSCHNSNAMTPVLYVFDQSIKYNVTAARGVLQWQLLPPWPATDWVLGKQSLGKSATIYRYVVPMFEWMDGWMDGWMWLGVYECICVIVNARVHDPTYLRTTPIQHVDRTLSSHSIRSHHSTQSYNSHNRPKHRRQFRYRMHMFTFPSPTREVRMELTFGVSRKTHMNT